MPAPVKRVPPPPLLALTLPPTSLIPKPAGKKETRIPSSPHTRPPTTNTSPTVVDADESITTTNQEPVTVTGSNSLRNLIQRLNQINAEMKEDIARLKVVIGETENRVKLLHAERAHRDKAESHIDVAPALSENEARDELQMC